MGDSNMSSMGTAKESAESSVLPGSSALFDGAMRGDGSVHTSSVAGDAEAAEISQGFVCSVCKVSKRPECFSATQRKKAAYQRRFQECVKSPGDESRAAVRTTHPTEEACVAAEQTIRKLLAEVKKLRVLNK